MEQKAINPLRVTESIELVRKFVGEDGLEGLIAALEALAAAPQEDERLMALMSAFDEIGAAQGVVLTYAPYIGVILSDQMFADDNPEDFFPDEGEPG